MRYSAQFDVKILMDRARERTDLTDFGPDHFVEPLKVLTTAIRKEARLHERGAAIQSERLVNALANRLRKQALMARHPEIADEQVDVSAIIVGLPRTGSTMLHRLLAASPQATATRWWETIYPLPRVIDDHGDVDDRRRDAEALVVQILDASIGFDAIHPLEATAFDEELPLIEQSFMSNIPESMLHVPSYGEWLLNADQRLAYRELIDWLRILQWQDRDRRGKSWILKAPHHLTAVRTVLDVFPQAVIAMTHRRVDHVMGSWYSMVASLTGGNTDADFSREQAAHWTQRLRRNLEAMMAVRVHDESRFMDIHYRDLLTAPLEHARRTFATAGLNVSAADETAWAEWLAANQRDGRPSHKYDVADFGISANRLQKDFAFYSDVFDPAR